MGDEAAAVTNAESPNTCRCLQHSLQNQVQTRPVCPLGAVWYKPQRFSLQVCCLVEARLSLAVPGYGREKSFPADLLSRLYLGPGMRAAWWEQNP